MAIGATVIASLFFNKGITMVGAFSSSLIGTLGPITTLIASILVLGEVVTWQQWVAVVIVTVGVTFSQLPTRT